MVRALLSGAKTQTRRIVKLDRDTAQIGGDVERAWPDKAFGVTPCLKVPCANETVQRLRNPWMWPNEDPTRLWVREAWAVDESLDAQKPINLAPTVDLEYLADGHRRKPARSFDRGRYRHARFMCRWASRLTLEVLDVRAERLHDISAEDVIAEGIDPAPHRCGCERCAQTSEICSATASSLVLAYAELWASINGRASWDANPFVWALTFTRVIP